MNKKRLRQVIAVAVFFILLILAVTFTYRVIRWKDTSGEYYSCVDQLKNTPQNTVDAVFVGSSHVYCGVYPSVFWENHGIAAFDMSVSGQDKVSEYYCLKELLKTQSPKIVFVDLFSLGYDMTAVEANQYRNLLALPTSADNVKHLTEYFGADTKEQRKKISDYLLRWPILHTRYRELGKYDYIENPDNRFLRGERITFEYKEVDMSMMGSANPEPAPLSVKDKKWLEDLVRLSEDYDFNLVFTLYPCCMDEEGQQIINAAWDFAKEKNIPVLDFTKSDCELKLDETVDFMDVGHLNYRGARKLSSYLDDYLAGSGNLPDHRGDEKYKQWEQDLSYRYKMEEHNMMNEINDLGSLVDLAASNSDYTVIISREFEDMGGFDENFDCLRQLGMTEEEFARGGVWVYENGNLEHIFLYEEGQEASYRLGKYDTLFCRYNGDFQEGNVMIGSEDCSNVGFYFVITVYDHEREEIVTCRGF